MKSFEIVAHRGIPGEAPENTLASYQLALVLGADAVEIDIRLTADQVPIVYHYYYLDNTYSATGAVFSYTLDEIREMNVYSKDNETIAPGRISTLEEILEIFAGKIGLEIEIKGPEPEAPRLIGDILKRHQTAWDSMEVTSYEPALLLAVQEVCPGITVDLLYPRAEAWKGSDVIMHEALHLSRLAHARAVHLHPTQISPEMVTNLQAGGIETHAWDVNDLDSLKHVTGIGIARICTDQFRMVKAYRDQQVGLAAAFPGFDGDHTP